jgi:murein DD-endopeptidase MepM/ murein hydrolase activator NlpD
VLAIRALAERRRALPDRVLRDGLRVVSLGGSASLPLDSVQRAEIDDEVWFLTSLATNERRLADDEADLASIIESVGAKHAELARLRAHSRGLVGAADAGAAQVGVLRAMADQSAAVSNAIAELMRSATAATVTTTWQWPLRGFITQRFGPSELALEPPVTYRGIPVAHFHDGVDIGAPLGTAVVAPAAGRVTFVGHLPDGAMVVVVAHDDGLVSLAAHLDDAFAPPPVRAGAVVRAGEVIGYIGLTGMTTGPHLHFAVHDASGPVDPLVILSRQ